MKKFLLIAVAALTFLAGCNTVSGVGKDVKAGGQAVSNAADDVKANM
ncbi:entericidin A/B family lipoprotein [Snodgrassella sp. CFCC 13594]|nr:entericidin A/B family lipoprotein [Snodgrassella sp. CFCC 13594]